MYELKHFCLQYHEWEAEINRINLISSGTVHMVPGRRRMDPVGDASILRDRYLHRMDLVNRAIEELESPIGYYIFRAVTEDLTFPAFEAMGIPCGRDYYYDHYRRFFWILDKLRE